MKTRIIVLLVMPALVARLNAQPQAPPSASEVAAIKKDVVATIDKYYRLFTERNPKGIADETFNIPWIVIGGGGPQADVTKEQATARFEASMKQLVDSGWGKSIFTTENVCVINANAAIASDRCLLPLSRSTAVEPRKPVDWVTVGSVV